MVCALFWVPSLSAQTATVEVEENLRAEPNGEIVARVRSGAVVDVVERRGGWLAVELAGWVWARSLLVTDRAGFDLVVSPEEGERENLRAAPQGTVLATLEAGALLDELERRPGWIRVRRRAWIWEASTSVDDAGGGEEESGGADPPPAGSAAEGETEPTGGAPDVLILGEASAIRMTPGGDTLATGHPGAELQVLERRDGVARVRVEGWVRLGGEAVADAGSVATEATPADVVAEPERYAGRVVAWELQFISLERADRFRPEFFAGEPYLLTRTSDGEGSFVYVAVGPDHVDEVEGLIPLERLGVTGRIRTGSSSLTGSPILDLIELRRRRAR